MAHEESSDHFWDTYMAWARPFFEIHKFDWIIQSYKMTFILSFDYSH